MRTVEPSGTAASRGWTRRADPAVSVVIATHRRERFLAELITALEALIEPAGGFEVIIADDGSTDGTWPALRDLTGHTDLALLALRLPASGGPAMPRNTGVLHARAPVVAFTDDDCLPEAGWVVELLAALRGPVGIVQGLTRRDPAGPTGPWDRTIDVAEPSALYETCNLALRRDLFTAYGGFTSLRLGIPKARGFGEDALLGSRVAREHGMAWAPAAVVRHRWVPGGFGDYLTDRLRLMGMPLLAREVPEFAARARLGVFLTAHTMRVDAAIAGVAAAIVGRRGWPLLAVLPWMAEALPTARHRRGRPVLWRLAQLAVGDAVGAAGLVAGSVRHRRLLI